MSSSLNKPVATNISRTELKMSGEQSSQPKPEVKVSSADPAPALDTSSDEPMDLNSALEQMARARAAQYGADRAPKKEVTYDEFQKMIDSTALFMRETPKDSGEDNYVLEALKSMMFDGDGDEVALNFKNHGNELYAQKSYKDAIQAYTQGIDAGSKDNTLRVSLLNNRAACNVALKNWGAVLKDTSAIIALAASADPPANPPPKALFRSAQALAALEKWDEALDAITRGLNLPGEGAKADWLSLQSQTALGKKRAQERAERERRKPLREAALKAAIRDRGLIVVNTAHPPENPHPLDFDPEGVTDVPLSPPEVAATWQPPNPQTTPLIFPTFLLYPQHNMSDLITHFHELTSFDQQLGAIFPADPQDTSVPWADWDTKHEYYVSNLAVYAETKDKRLLKCGKGIWLRDVIEKAKKSENGKQTDGIVLRDGLLSFVVLVRGEEEKEWIENFKKVRDGAK